MKSSNVNSAVMNQVSIIFWNYSSAVASMRNNSTTKGKASAIWLKFLARRPG